MHTHNFNSHFLGKTGLAGCPTDFSNKGYGVKFLDALPGANQQKHTLSASTMIPKCWLVGWCLTALSAQTGYIMP